jgi:hypothetical protein
VPVQSAHFERNAGIARGVDDRPELTPDGSVLSDRQQTRGQHGLPTVGDCVAGATPPVDNPAPDHIEKAENLST